MITTIAAAQFAPESGAVRRNVDRVAGLAEEAARQGASLVVFPECSLSGYQLDSATARSSAVTLDGPELDRLRRLADDGGVTFVIGVLERAAEALHNSAVTLVPGRPPVVYRKSHLPRMGVDEFCTPGSGPYRPIATPIGSLGVLICYDLRFPEPARLLALAGAAIIAVPTNWPVTATDYPDFLLRARASENRVAIVAADRCGEEGSVTYLGRSQLVTAQGMVMAEAGTGPELVVRALEHSTEDARRVAGRPDGPSGLLADRRVDLYDVLDLSTSQGSGSR